MKKSIHIFILLSLSGTAMGQAQTVRLEKATLGAGCFWCVETIFERLNGVEEVVSGYAGGHLDNPDYKQVCAGTSGHAEVVQITYNPDIISYTGLLEVFFSVHDPTTLNRQGADRGTQYRSVILYHNELQRRKAAELIKKLDAEKIWPDPLVTTLEAFDVFYPAEGYHQSYFENNPNEGYCRVVIQPKVKKFEALFRDMLK
ncbi:MAG: peptide-methionine (S)-S-oxide reductase [Bacteroidetes bacterium]|nr:MAG: peptide-methionine (S)-S-oxide reductase [Bacteroidota bacterium]